MKTTKFFTVIAILAIIVLVSSCTTSRTTVYSPAGKSLTKTGLAKHPACSGRNYYGYRGNR